MTFQHACYVHIMDCRWVHAAACVDAVSEGHVAAEEENVRSGWRCSEMAEMYGVLWRCARLCHRCAVRWQILLWDWPTAGEKLSQLRALVYSCIITASTPRRYPCTVYAIVLRLSVCRYMSITSRCSTKSAKRNIIQPTLHDDLDIVIRVFWCQRSGWSSKFQWKGKEEKGREGKGR